jgi:hypothetical protein
MMPVFILYLAYGVRTLEQKFGDFRSESEPDVLPGVPLRDVVLIVLALDIEQFVSLSLSLVRIGNEQRPEDAISNALLTFLLVFHTAMLFYSIRLGRTGPRWIQSYLLRGFYRLYMTLIVIMTNPVTLRYVIGAFGTTL